MTQNRSARRLEMTLLAFLVVAAFSLVAVYATDPLLYITMFPFKLTATQRYPFPLTMFLVTIVIFIVLVILGIMRHWRWLFWVLWIALSCSILEIPATLFQLAGVIPGHLPVWYSFVRMGAACVAGGMAVWMGWIYRHAGVWGLGKKKR